MTLTSTNFNFPGQIKEYHGKVRDVYTLDGSLIVMVATDRISAFDVVLPKGIPYKGQVLNQIANYFLDATADIVPNWKLSEVDPCATIGKACTPFKVEMIIRGYLAGSAWREYASGVRSICGVTLPEGLRQNERLPEPIITPTTKADEGHDLNISPEEIVAQGLMTRVELDTVMDYTRRLFAAGSRMAAEKGLVLVDTKYEFGKYGDDIILIDEIHTPDSSRYFYADTYEELFRQGLPQRQLSKEFVREWLMDNGFMGQPGQKLPEMTDEVCRAISDRYIELYRHVTGREFQPAPEGNAAERIATNVLDFLDTMNRPDARG